MAPWTKPSKPRHWGRRAVAKCAPYPSDQRSIDWARFSISTTDQNPYPSDPYPSDDAAWYERDSQPGRWTR